MLDEIKYLYTSTFNLFSLIKYEVRKNCWTCIPKQIPKANHTAHAPYMRPNEKLVIVNVDLKRNGIGKYKYLITATDWCTKYFHVKAIENKSAEEIKQPLKD